MTERNPKQGFGEGIIKGESEDTGWSNSILKLSQTWRFLRQMGCFMDKVLFLVV